MTTVSRQRSHDNEKKKPTTKSNFHFTIKVTKHLRFMINGIILILKFLDGDVPRTPSYGVYISQLIRFARVCSNVMTSTTETYF